VKGILQKASAGLLFVALALACEDEDPCEGLRCGAVSPEASGGGAGAPTIIGPASDACLADSECDDGKFCNGAELCSPETVGADKRGCIAAASAPCEDSTCDEAADECVSCDDGDVDNDGYQHIACGGDDCDDNDDERYPGNVEVCDAAGHDEDCDLTTLGSPDDADEDEDTFVNAACCNEQKDGDLRCGTDCADDADDIHPEQTETCNGIDDDCDGVTDGAEETDDLKTRFFYDADGTGFGAEGEETLECTAPHEGGWVLHAGSCAELPSDERAPESVVASEPTERATVYFAIAYTVGTTRTLVSPQLNPATVRIASPYSGSPGSGTVLGIASSTLTGSGANTAHEGFKLVWVTSLGGDQTCEFSFDPVGFAALPTALQGAIVNAFEQGGRLVLDVERPGNPQATDQVTIELRRIQTGDFLVDAAGAKATPAHHPGVTGTTLPAGTGTFAYQLNELGGAANLAVDTAGGLTITEPAAPANPFKRLLTIRSSISGVPTSPGPTNLTNIVSVLPIDLHVPTLCVVP
jgi:hypothetical protein